MNQRIFTISTTLIIAFGMGIVGPLSADTFNVNTTVDAVDAVPGDGLCSTGVGFCSLRAAVMEANALPGPHTIILPAGVYSLTEIGAAENFAVTGDLDIMEDTTIVGAGPAETIIDALWADRAFHTWVFPIPVLTVRGLTIRNGNAGIGSGGAIFRQGAEQMLLENVHFLDTYGSNGGAVYHGGGELTVRDCVFENNVADSDGGSIWKGNAGNLTVTNCRFFNTSAIGHGGSITQVGSGDTSITDCAFVASDAGTVGGAFSFSTPTGSLTVTNSQFTDCQAHTAEGGGIRFIGLGNVTIQDCLF